MCTDGRGNTYSLSRYQRRLRTYILWLVIRVIYIRTQQLVNIIVTLLSGVVHPLMKRLVTEHPEYFCPVAMLPYLLVSQCMRQPLVYRSSDSLLCCTLSMQAVHIVNA